MTTIRIKTNRKDLPVHGLEKIPDEVIIEKLRIQLGQSESYIEELEAENESLKQNRNPDIVKLENEVKSLKGSLKRISEENKNTIYEEKIKTQKKEIVNLRQTISNLVSKIANCKEK